MHILVVLASAFALALSGCQSEESGRQKEKGTRCTGQTSAPTAEQRALCKKDNAAGDACDKKCWAPDDFARIAGPRNDSSTDAHSNVPEAGAPSQPQSQSQPPSPGNGRPGLPNPAIPSVASGVVDCTYLKGTGKTIDVRGKFNGLSSFVIGQKVCDARNGETIKEGVINDCEYLDGEVFDGTPLPCRCKLSVKVTEKMSPQACRAKGGT